MFAWLRRSTAPVRTSYPPTAYEQGYEDGRLSIGYLQTYDRTVLRDVRERALRLQHLLGAIVYEHQQRTGGPLRVDRRAVDAHILYQQQQDDATDCYLLGVRE